MSTHVAWMLHLNVLPGQQAALKSLLAEMVAATAANEPGTLSYEWSLSADGTRCHLWERYQDSAAAMLHIGTFGARFAERFLALLTPTEVCLYGAPDAAVREALAGFGAVVMEPIGGFSR